MMMTITVSAVRELSQMSNKLTVNLEMLGQLHNIVYFAISFIYLLDRTTDGWSDEILCPSMRHVPGPGRLETLG